MPRVSRATVRLEPRLGAPETIRRLPLIARRARSWRRARRVGPAGRRRLFRLLMVSWLLHGMILLAILMRMNLQRPEAPPELPSPVAMVFEPPADGARTAPDPTPLQLPLAPTTPETAPAESAMPVPPPPAPPPPAPALAMPVPPMPEPMPEAVPEQQAEESPLPVPPMQMAPPPPVLAEQEPEDAPAEIPLPLPAPPPPQFAMPPRAPPAPPAPPRPRPAPAPSSPFSLSSPSQYSLGTPMRPAQPATRSPPMAMGPAAPSPRQSFGQFAEVTKGHVDPSWMSRLHEWWQRNGYYPEPAARMGQDGQVKIEIMVDRSGRVRNLELLRRSGSQWLDAGAQAVFRNAQLPPFPPNTSDDGITLTLTINYVLIRQ